MQLESLYQEIILDHYRHPHHKGLREPFASQVHHVNPTCGDEVTLRVEVEDGPDGTARVRRVTWLGQGCSISQASTSVMTDLVTGTPLAEVEELGSTFRALMQARGKGLDDDAEDALGDATAFTGVAKYPARVKCALLGWTAFTDALARAGVDITLPEPVAEKG